MVFFRTIGFFCVFPVLVSGCANQYIPASNLRLIKSPEIGLISTAEIGQSIVDSTNAVFKESIVIKHDIVMDYSGNKFVIPSKAYEITNRSNEFKISWDFNSIKTQSPVNVQFSELKVSFDGKACFLESRIGVVLPSGESVTYDTNGASGPIDGLRTIFVGAGGIWSSGDSSSAFDASGLRIDGCEFKDSLQSINNGGFRKELVYLGKTGSTISFSYREFFDNMARPAFYSDVKYDLNDGNVIGFKGARFEVLNATNTNFEYRVLKHLDD